MAPNAGRRMIASRFALCSALVLSLLGALPAAAAAASGTSSIADRPGVAELRIARDPETGEWGLAPLGEENALGRGVSPDEQIAINQSAAGLVTEALPGGGWAMNLQGRFQSYSIARRDASGATRFDCSEDPISLFHWLAEVPTPVDAFGRPVR